MWAFTGDFPLDLGWSGITINNMVLDKSTGITDPLTGAYSRASLKPRLQEEVERASRYNASFSIIFLDLDHFKSVNDAFGHTQGDQVLVELVERLRTTARVSDLIFRYGGDEFLLLLPQTTMKQAMALAQRILKEIRESPFRGTRPITLSTSMGVASFPAEAANAEVLFEKVDLRLYEAKRRGRGQVVGQDPAKPASLPFEEVSRLVERDEAMETVRRFLRALPEKRRGVLMVAGAPGSGRSRLIAEIGREAQLWGLEVILLRGTQTQKSRALGAVSEACKDWEGLPPISAGVKEFIQAFERLVEARARGGLLFAVDDFPELDWATLDLLHYLFTSNIPCLGMAYATDRERSRRIFHSESPLSEVVELRAFSPSGLHTWLRSLLHWEPPEAFVSWLYQETDGLPAILLKGLAILVERGVLEQKGDEWIFNRDFTEIFLRERLGIHVKRPPHNLPALLTSFVGREYEIRQIKALLGEKRLVTLLGPAGVGKTRLALEVATDLLDDFENGVFFIPLASINNPDLVATTIAQTLGIKEIVDQPLAESLKNHLRDRQSLLVLDNFEQVTRASLLAAELLAVAPRLKILVTSREVLHIYGEYEFQVPPLATPNLKMLASSGSNLIPILLQSAAVVMFVECAQAVKSGFTLTSRNAAAIAEICVRLDGLPLAIELAAARINVLSPQTILSRLNKRLALLTSGAQDLPARQQTLRGAIDWSYDLLDEGEKTLFARLAVFVGGCSLEALEAVCQDDGRRARLERSRREGEGMKDELTPIFPGLHPADMLDRIASLVDKSLLLQQEGVGGETRFTMLETIREYALERLEESGDMVLLRLRHANYYLGLAEQAEPELGGARQAIWLDRLEIEHDNLRAALVCFLESGKTEQRMRLSAALWRFWHGRGYLSEGHKWLTSALAGSSAHTAARANALRALGDLAYREGNYSTAHPLFDESLAIFRELNDEQGIARSLNNLGLITLEQGDYENCRLLFEESLAIQRKLGDRIGIAKSLNNLGLVALQHGDYATAYRLLEESLSIEREMGNKLGIAISLMNLGEVARPQGNFSLARALYEESLTIFRELGHREGATYSLNNLGHIARDQGEYETARSLYLESLMIRKELGDKPAIAYSLEGLAALAAAQGEVVPPPQCDQHLRRAARLCGAAEALREAIGVPLEPVDRATYDRTVMGIRARLDETAFAASWSEGRVMTLEQAINYALGAPDL